MKCEFCGKPVKDTDKYCTNCGAKVKAAAPAQAATTETAPKSEKKHTSAGKIILIVFLCATLLVVLLFGAAALIFRAVTKNVDFNDIISRVDDWQYENDREYEDSFDEWFSQYFDDDDNGTFTPDREYKGRYDDYKGVENFIPGTIDKKTGAYKSEYGNLEFQFPTSWNVYNDSELAQVYAEEGASKTLGNNKLYVYDFYASDTLTGHYVYVRFYNKDYFAEYKNLDALNESIKDGVYDYAAKYAYKADYAEDSTITINGEKYDQLACRVSDGGDCVYIYDFTRDLGDYYMNISISAYDLDSVGEIIDILGSKG